MPRGTPNKGSGQRARPPGKSQVVPSDLAQAGFSCIPQGGLPLTPLLTQSPQAWAGMIPVSCSGIVCTW